MVDENALRARDIVEGMPNYLGNLMRGELHPALLVESLMKGFIREGMQVMVRLDPSTGLVIFSYNGTKKKPNVSEVDSFNLDSFHNTSGLTGFKQREFCSFEEKNRVEGDTFQLSLELQDCRNVRFPRDGNGGKLQLTESDNRNGFLRLCFRGKRDSENLSSCRWQGCIELSGNKKGQIITSAAAVLEASMERYQIPVFRRVATSGA